MPNLNSNITNLVDDYYTFKDTDLTRLDNLQHASLPRRYSFFSTFFNVPIDAQILALKILDLPENLFSELNKAEDIDVTVKNIIDKVKIAHQTRALKWHPDRLTTESDKEKGQALMTQVNLAKDLLIYQIELNHANYRKFGYLPWHLTGLNNLKNVLDVILWPTKAIAIGIYAIIKAQLESARLEKGTSLNKKEKLVSIIQSLKWPLILAIPATIILILVTALLSLIAIIPLTMALVKLAPVPIILSVKLIQAIVSMIKSFMTFTVSAIKACMDFTVSAVKTLFTYFANSKVSPANKPLITYFVPVPTALTTEPKPIDPSKADDRQPTPYSYNVEKMRICHSPKP